MALEMIQVGMGGWGRNWAELMATAPELVDVVAHVEMVPELRERTRTQVGVPAERIHADLASALEKHPSAAVLVTTAVGAHVAVAREALSAGRNVLTEKPFAPTVEEGRQLVEEAGAAGLVLAVSQNYRWFPATQTVHRMLREGAIGEVSGVTVRFRKWDNDAPEEGNLHYALRHPLLLDMSVHHFDLMRWLFGPASDLVIRAWNPPWSKYREPAEAAGVLRFEGGAVVDYSGSWVSSVEPTLWAGEWTLEGAKGALGFVSRGEGDTPDTDAVWLQPRGKRRRQVPLDEVRYVDRLGSVAEFARAIAAGDEPTISGRDNLGTLALVDAAMRSADTDAPVSLV